MAKASVRLTLNKSDGKHDVKKIKQGLDTLPGVCSVSVSDGSVTVDFDTTGTQSGRIKQQLEKMGYEIPDSQ